MRKRVFGRKLKRTTNQRKALFKSLAEALVLHGRIKTTEAKAKSVRSEVEKLITRAKKNDSNSLMILKKHVHATTAELLMQIAPAFKDRNGGYTRIIKLGGRKKDNAPMVILEFTEKTTIVPETPKAKATPKTEVKEAKIAVDASKKTPKEVKSKPAGKAVKKTAKK